MFYKTDILSVQPMLGTYWSWQHPDFVNESYEGLSLH